MSKFEVIQGVVGCCLALDDTRIAGPKPWGGGTVIHSWETNKEYKAVDELTVERDAYFEMVKRVQADCDACDELIRDMWKCLSAHIESAINDGGCGYPYSPQTRGCGEGCTVNGEDCSMSLIERRMRRLGIEVDK